MLDDRMAMSGSRRRGLELSAAVLAAVVAVAVIALDATPPAAASCGGVQKASPSRKRAHRLNPKGRPPLAIGDSSMLLAVHNLAHAGYRVNARGCRQFTEGIGVVGAAKRRHELPHMTAMALGADASISRSQIEHTLHLLGPRRVLCLVTPRELGGGSGADAQHVRDAGRRHPHRVRVLDWVNYSQGHPGWFQPDGLHLTFPGAHAFTHLFRKCLPLARAGRFPAPR
jgi:hypothetical protein